MVCFVHDRHYLSKFHGAVNQLRQTNEFTNLTLKRLPKRCCSCPEKQVSAPSTTTTTKPCLSSLDIDAMRLICLQMDLQQYVDNHIVSSPAEILHYTVLPFAGFLEEEIETGILNQFIAEQYQRLHMLQTIHHASLDFVESNSSNQILNEIVYLKYNLVSKCTTYSEALEAINGLWIVITLDDQSHLDLVIHALQRQWMQFLNDKETLYINTVYKWQRTLPSKVRANKLFKGSKKTYSKQPKGTIARFVRQQSDLYESKMDDELLEEETLPLFYPQFNFLLNRFQNSNKNRRPRTHRRQHMLALAMVA